MDAACSALQLRWLLLTIIVLHPCSLHLFALMSQVAQAKRLGSSTVFVTGNVILTRLSDGRSSTAISLPSTGFKSVKDSNGVLVKDVYWFPCHLKL